MTLSTTSHSSAIDKKLPLCGNSPNCVSSQAQVQDKEHYLAPFKFKTSPEQAWQALRQAIEDTPRIVITHETDTSLHAEATSFLMRFVDDINIILDEQAGVIHIRSASRTGHSDFGVNRKRIETLREQLQQAHVLE
ncbi:MAG: DUF1499 domain-containing protein [Methylococcales bacterium]